ncbi:hypothetical protein HON59_00500 [bacterium]|nr:hypothetical protein [bacterium]MBT4894532.1 hypothetical protein [bacterium]
MSIGILVVGVIMTIVGILGMIHHRNDDYRSYKDVGYLFCFIIGILLAAGVWAIKF